MNPYMQVIHGITFSLVPASFQSSSLLLSRSISNSRRMVNREVSEHWKWGSVKCVLEWRAHFFFVELGEDGHSTPPKHFSGLRRWERYVPASNNLSVGKSAVTLWSAGHIFPCWWQFLVRHSRCGYKDPGTCVGLVLRGQQIYFLEIPRPNDK